MHLHRHKKKPVLRPAVVFSALWLGSGSGWVFLVFCVVFGDVVLLQFIEPVELFAGVEDEEEEKDFEAEVEGYGRDGLFCGYFPETKACHVDLGDVVDYMQCRSCFDSFAADRDQGIDES